MFGPDIFGLLSWAIKGAILALIVVLFVLSWVWNKP